MPKEIQLTQGKVALVDDEDFAMLVGMGRWCYNSSYATRAAGVRMHRVILAAPKGAHVDHINGDTLDNRRSNLRFCTDSQNQMNRRAVRGVSKFKGVVWQKRASGNGFWKATITKDGVVRYLGSFHTDLEAAAAYNSAALELYGAFAAINDLSQAADERRSSVRPAQINKRGSLSKYKGVTYDADRKKWAARLKFKGATHLAKRYDTEEEAALAYNTAARTVFGPGAVLNSIP